MPKVCFTSNLKRHVDCPEMIVDGVTVSAALDVIFSKNPVLRGYILDDQGSLHKHMAVLVNGIAIRDRKKLEEPVSPEDEIYIVQALSGG